MYYKQPRYYNEFKCLGTGCTANCCYGWNIVWGKEEINKVKNAPNCPEHLKKIIENSFVPIDSNKGNMYKVKLDETGRCPCQTEDRLCMIQKELGAEYLSDTCMIYPRYNAFNDSNVIYRGCYLSCMEVVNILLNDEKAADLVIITSNDVISGKNVVFPNALKMIETYPEYEYRGKIFEFFYELIGNKKYPVETSIILGALAAQKLTQLIDDKKYDLIPDALKAFGKQLHNAAALRSIDNIKPNYNVKFGIADKIIEDALDFRMTDVLKNENGEPDIDRYLTGEERLNEMMKDKPFWLRNIALTLVLELCVPFKSSKRTVFENYSFFAAAVSCLKLNAVAAAFAPEKLDIQTKGQTLHFEGIEKIYGLTGVICRRILQNTTNFDNVLRVLNEFDMDSPAYLALLVK